MRAIDSDCPIRDSRAPRHKILRPSQTPQIDGHSPEPGNEASQTQFELPGYHGSLVSAIAGHLGIRINFRANKRQSHGFDGGHTYLLVLRMDGTYCLPVAGMSGESGRRDAT
jgi:hypothetical protein